MAGGQLCIHTISTPDWKKKLQSDIEQLCLWIRKYYIEKNTDKHYEHLVVNESLVDDQYFSFNYAQTDSSFLKGEFGLVNYKCLGDGLKYGKTIKNFIVVSYHNVVNSTIHKSPFSRFYNFDSGCTSAPYIVTDRIPGIYGKFLFENYLDFEPLISQSQMKFVWDYVQQARRIKTTNHLFPLFIGYHIPNGEIAWNVAMIDINAVPTKGIPEYINGRKTGTWISKFIDQQIKWVLTNDISPKHFFGRGCFPVSVTEKRILIMGIGAVGSMVAHTLVRGGCRNISLYDFDIKQPGNVCRSEYDFFCPTSEKMNDLSKKLHSISPYVNVDINNIRFDEYVKMASHPDTKEKESVFTKLSENYDIIIDCTTDDDVMYALEQLNLPIDVVNISISNHADKLVCAFSPSIYGFVRRAYENLIKNDHHDIFYPTGCWNPTFKATYNDIASKLQYALKRIISMLSGSEIKQNFIISEDTNGMHFQPW
jgi:hypothetical protein